MRLISQLSIKACVIVRGAQARDMADWKVNENHQRRKDEQIYLWLKVEVSQFLFY